MVLCSSFVFRVTANERMHAYSKYICELRNFRTLEIKNPKKEMNAYDRSE